MKYPVVDTWSQIKNQRWKYQNELIGALHMFTKFYLCMESTTKSPKIWLNLFEQNTDSIILKFEDIF